MLALVYSAMLAFIGAVAGHGILAVPLSRNVVDRDDPRWAHHRIPLTNEPNGASVPGSAGWSSSDEWNEKWGSNGTSPFEPGQAALWFSQGCTIGCPACLPRVEDPWDKDLCGKGAPPTICKPEHRTVNIEAECGSPSDWTKHNPWRAPGAPTTARESVCCTTIRDRRVLSLTPPCHWHSFQSQLEPQLPTRSSPQPHPY